MQQHTLASAGELRCVVFRHRDYSSGGRTSLFSVRENKFYKKRYRELTGSSWPDT
jgi:hypothetical protein